MSTDFENSGNLDSIKTCKATSSIPVIFHFIQSTTIAGGGFEVLSLPFPVVIFLLELSLSFYFSTFLVCTVY